MTQTNNQPPAAITANDIAQDLEGLIANSSSLPVSVPPVLPSVQSVFLSPPSVQPVLLSAVSTNEIYTDFQQLTNSACPVDPAQRDLYGVPSVHQSVESVLISHKHSIDGFANWLKLQKLSRASIKNYLSDLRQLSVWLQKNHPQVPLCDLTSKICHLYISSLTAPRATVNRKLASLRKFCFFLGQTISVSSIPEDPPHTLLKKFKAHLLKHRYSKKTITNYLSDLRHYLNWVQKTQISADPTQIKQIRPIRMASVKSV